MISLGSSDERKGLSLGFVIGGEMEETDLEEGETFYYEKDDDSTIDPDVALSYIDEKLQDVLGQFQKDFEGGVTAENLGAKFGGYGSFLPTYQRSPALSNQRTPPEVHNYRAPKSPNNMHLEDGCHNSVDASSSSLSARLGPAKAPAVNDSTKRDVCMSSTRAGESTSKCELIKKSTNPSDQKILKVRIKVGSDDFSTRKNAEIYSGLGLDVSPSSSLNDSPMDSAELSCGPKDAPDESPTSILQIMTSFPLHGSLMLSPLPNDLLCFIQKENLQGHSRYGPVRKGNQKSTEISMNGSDSGRADPKVLGENKPKPSEKYSFSVDLNNDNSNDARKGFGVLPKKETDIDTETCEELVSSALRLPLLSNSYCNVANSARDNAREVDGSSLDGNGGAKDEPFSDLAKEEPLESGSTQVHGRVEKPSGDRRVWENKKANSEDKDSVFRRKGGNLEGEKTDVPAKGESNVSEGRKTLNAEPMDPPKQKAGQKATSHEEVGMKLAPGMEQSSSGDKMKSKGSQSHGAQGAEVPKDGLKIDYSSLPESRKSTHVDSYVSKSDVENFKKDYGKARDRYRDFFGDLELEQGYNEKDSEEMPYQVRLKDPAVIEKSTFEFNTVSKERLNVRKIQKPSSSKAYPRVASSLAPFPGNGPISNASLTVAPLVNEDWVCCDKCQKWRLLPLGTNPDSLPEKWLCSMLYWLPEMNRCSISEDETTKAVIALSQVPAPESQCRQHGDPGRISSGVSSADARNSYQNHQDLGLHTLSSGRKKKCGLKDVSNETYQDGPTQFSNIMKKNLQVSVTSQSLNGVNQSPVNEVDFQCSGQYSSLVTEKPRHKGKQKQKEKNKLLESYSGGGDTHNSNKINKRGTDQDCFRAAKKVKADGMSMNVSGKDQRKYSDRLEDSKHDSKVSVRNPKDQIQITSDDGLLHMAKCDDRDAVKKRKGNEFQETCNYTVPLINAGHHLQDCRDFMEETSENDHRKEKKARVSKSGGKETWTSKGSDGTATSSSSKVSGSHKNKANIQEVKGSPVESVSSSPLRFLNPDKVTSTTRNLGGKDDSQDVGFFATASSRKCSDGEDDGGSNRSETRRKDGTFTVTHRGSLESSALDFQDRNLGHLSGSKDKAEIVPSPEFATRHATDGDADTLGEGASYPCKPQTSDQCRNEEKGNNNQYHANGSRPRKSGKGSFSRSKDKSRYLTSELDKGNRKLSDSFNESIAHTPHEEKSKAGKNKLHDKFAINSHKVEKNLGPEEDSTGKLTSECGKRDSQSKFGRHNGSDVGVDTVSSQDPKQNLLLDRDGEQSSKRFHSEKTDRVDASEGGKSYSLPPSGRGQNETLRCPQPILRSQKENGANILSVGVSEGDDALKAPKQIKKIENQNGNKPINSEHPTPNGQKVRDLDAASPVRRDSSSQAATNAVKEAKNLKHLADRLKQNSGSSSESTGLYFQAALKFLHGASLLESCNGDNTKHGEMIPSIQMYSSTAKLCEFCAHEYEKSKDMAAASLAHKCMEVAYLRVIYSSHSSANRDRNELQTALQIVPTGESPSSSASDVDNLNNPATVDKVALHKDVSSPQVAGNHVIAARNRSNFVRMLNFAQNVNFAMEASRKARIAFAAAKPKLEETKYKEGTSSVKRALDFNFQDVEGLLRLVRLAMEAISR